MSGRPAVFLDRDGVLNPNVRNPANGKMESPYKPEDFRLFPDAPEALRLLDAAGFELFLVSNQPSFAKGTARMQDLLAVHGKLLDLLAVEGLGFRECFYCHHHPEAVRPEMRACDCRKPSPGSLYRARERHGLDLAASWMVGDRNADIECGKRAGTRTILVRDPSQPQAEGARAADRQAAGILEAALFIVSERSFP